MIRVEGLQKDSRLRGVSFSVAAGESVAIVGPSGAGKTTLLNLLAGVDSPSSGSLQVNGLELAGLSRTRLAEYRRSTLGFVFQHFHLLPHLSAAENVMLPLLLQGAGAREALRRAEAALEEVGLAGFASRAPATLSGGEQQRVAVARALVAEPRLLLADEPTGSLDSANGAQVLALLLRLQKLRQATLLLVTHDPAVAAACSRRLHLRDGSLASD